MAEITTNTIYQNAIAALGKNPSPNYTDDSPFAKAFVRAYDIHKNAIESTYSLYGGSSVATLTPLNGDPQVTPEKILPFTNAWGVPSDYAYGQKPTLTRGSTLDNSGDGDEYVRVNSETVGGDRYSAVYVEDNNLYDIRGNLVLTMDNGPVYMNYKTELNLSYWPKFAIPLLIYKIAADIAPQFRVPSQDVKMLDEKANEQERKLAVRGDEMPIYSKHPINRRYGYAWRLYNQ